MKPRSNCSRRPVNLPLLLATIRSGATALLLLVFIACFLSFTSPPLLSRAQSTGQLDLGEIRAEQTTWVLDQRTRKGRRVADLSKSVIRNKTMNKTGVNEVEVSEDVGQLASRGPRGYSPSQIRRAYKFDEVGSTGKGQIIALVDAFDYPNAASDLSKFIKTFGLKQM